jgi:hypothetical protein
MCKILSTLFGKDAYYEKEKQHSPAYYFAGIAHFACTFPGI